MQINRRSCVLWHTKIVARAAFLTFEVMWYCAVMCRVVPHPLSYCRQMTCIWHYTYISGLLFSSLWCACYYLAYRVPRPRGRNTGMEHWLAACWSYIVGLRYVLIKTLSLWQTLGRPSYWYEENHDWIIHAFTQNTHKNDLLMRFIRVILHGRERGRRGTTSHTWISHSAISKVAVDQSVSDSLSIVTQHLHSKHSLLHALSHIDQI